MTMAIAVIGANFGDEGKGLMVDYFAHKYNGHAIRFNGGSQAGHTVVTPEGKRHIFNGHGSSSFVNFESYATSDFIVNVHALQGEHLLISALANTPVLRLNPNARVTLPCDMLINQELERSRGNNNHGSCGMGIFETIQRSKHHEFAINVNDCFLHSQKELEHKIYDIYKYYLKQRFDEINLVPPVIDETQIQDIARILTQLPYICTRKNAFDNSFNAIFEGAQGLLLDQNNKEYWPHLTPSNTGLRNVIKECRLRDFKEINVCYVTRAYVTRHGNGKIRHQIADQYEDNTNKLNCWQGSLRFGLLNIDYLIETIRRDIENNSGSGVAIIPSLAITHLDQDNKFSYVIDDIIYRLDHNEMVQKIKEFKLFDKIYTSYGATRKDVRQSI